MAHSTLLLRDHCPSRPTTLYAAEPYGRATAGHEGAQWKYLSNSEGTWGIPLIIRDIPNSAWLDAVTPYGYGGIHMDASLSPSQRVELWIASLDALKDAGIASVFFRFPPFHPEQALATQSFPGLQIERVSSSILIETPEGKDMLSSFSPSCRKQVRRGLRDGLEVSVLPATPENLAEFLPLYTAAMDRIGARPSYYFGQDYFETLLGLGDQLFVSQVTTAEGELVASSIIMVEDDIAHLHLVGANIRVQGVNNVRLSALLTWAQDNGFKKVHLGGGVSEGDSVWLFKKSFGGEPIDFHVGRLVVDQNVYDELTRIFAHPNGRTAEAATTYFPSYRQPH